MNNRKWSKDELLAAVDAYLHMLTMESDGLPYNKAEINRTLRNDILRNRNKSSIEFRMQNISSVMEALCLPRIRGYVPAKNLGVNVFKEIKQILENKKIINADLYESTDDDILLDKRVKELSKKIQLGKPFGVKKPEKILQQGVLKYKRDPLVKAWILNNSNGKCEKCNKVGPFEKEDGIIYLEIHHMTSLSDGGSDTIENTVALCPNCHRELHYSIDRLLLVNILKHKLNRLK